MSNSGAESPDWLRSFQAPTASLVSLSSVSKSSSGDSPLRESETISSPLEQASSLAVLPDEDASQSPEINVKTKSVKKQIKIEHLFSRRKKTDEQVKQNENTIDIEEISQNHKEGQGQDQSVLVLSSDSEQPLNEVTAKSEDDIKVKPNVKKATKAKPHKKDLKSNQTSKKENIDQENMKLEDKEYDAEIDTEDASNKNTTKPGVSTSRMPLVLSEKVNRNKALVECCEGDTIDLSGDMGAVGRIVVSETNQDVYFDLKGTIYKTTIVPSRTFCVVNVGQSEAKIEAIMNDFIQLKPQSNVYESETMVEGTLEGFSFDSEDETEKKTKNGSKATDEQSEGKADDAKGKAKKASVSGKKRGRPSKEKAPPAKKPRKNTTTKRAKKSKK